MAILGWPDDRCKQGPGLHGPQHVSAVAHKDLLKYFQRPTPTARVGRSRVLNICIFNKLPPGPQKKKNCKSNSLASKTHSRVWASD